MRILVTGGCGFIGSNFIKFLLTDNQKLSIDKVINIDKQTYAGKGRNLEHMNLDKHKKYVFIKEDICNKKPIERIFSSYKFDFLFNFAAESYVDRSIKQSEIFRKTNFEGTGVLLDVALKKGIQKFIQISTDEVYGSLDKDSPNSKETDSLKPRNPYSSSKAAADLLAISYFNTYNLPVLITRSSNTYGPYQFPEKILPLFITNLIQRKKVPLMWSDENPGLNSRDWLNVEDNCRAIWFVSQFGEIGEIYNISGENERTNIYMTKLLLDYFGYNEEMIEKIPHRKGHDFRYSVNSEKLKKLGFKHKLRKIEDEIPELCEWYKKNGNWWKPLKK